MEKMFKVHNSHPDVFKQAGAVVKEICKSPEHAKVRNSTRACMAILGKSRMHVVVESLSVNSVVSDG